MQLLSYQKRDFNKEYEQKKEALSQTMDKVLHPERYAEPPCNKCRELTAREKYCTTCCNPNAFHEY